MSPLSLFFTETDTRIIPLTQGLFALVDLEDYEKVIVHTKWCAHKSRQTYYAQGSGGYPRMHRFILGLSENDPEVDHINGNGLDNRKINLRLATSQQNKANSRKQRGETASKYKGVSKKRKKWVAQIQANGRYKHLGCFDLEEEAARAYDIAAKEIFGEFARTNL